MSSIVKKLERKRLELNLVKEAWERALLAQSYSSSDGTSKRDVTNANVSSLYTQMTRLEKEVEKLEGMVDGSCCKAFRVESLK